MKGKKITAILLTFLMVVSFMPQLVLAEESCVIKASSITATAGETVEITIEIENNPGIMGAELLFNFDNALTLVSATSGDAFSPLTMTKPGNFASPCKFVWDAQEISDTDIKDGTIVTLKFTVPQEAQIGTKYDIGVSAIDFVNMYLKPVLVNTKNGNIEVTDFMYGDLNDDKKVNTTDVIMLRRNIAGGYEQSINEKAADVNCDGKRNTTDVILERRYIAGGYGISFPYVEEKCSHKLEKTEYKEPTYTAEGNLEYWRCKACAKYFSDQNGEYEITFEETKIPILTKDEYSIQYMCNMVPVPADTYKPEEGKVLPRPELDKYTFLGWSDENDNMIGFEIPKGTTGNLVLYANWSSHRNMAVAVDKLEEPLIFEDKENGLMLFTYEIGEIRNVPLFTTLELQCANGIISTVTQTNQKTIDSTYSKEVAKTIAEATTDSASWTLESNWNTNTEVSEVYNDSTTISREEAETLSKSKNNTYNLSSTFGGSNFYSNTENSSFIISKNEYERNYQEDIKENNIELSVDAKYSKEANAGLGIPIPGVGNLNVGAKSGFEIGGGVDVKDYDKTTTVGTDGWSENKELAFDSSKTTTSTKSWNTQEGFSSSHTATESETIKNAISEMISKEYGYGKSYSEGGINSNSKEHTMSNSTSNEFSNAWTWHSAEIETVTREFKSTGHQMGGYRLVMAGTVHVFAVVGYDMINNSYFVYTHGILDDETKEYLDYSKNHSFNDYETSIIPFEIPYFVNEYVNNRLASTNGLTVDPETGMVTEYIPQGDDEVVVIPSYKIVSNNDDGYTVVKITGIADGLFEGNTKIKGVQLSKFISKISDSAFADCTSLEFVICPGVKEIGDYAFKGCTSLRDFSVPESVCKIGQYAFDGVSKINVISQSVDIATNVASSGADNIILDISAIPKDNSTGILLEVGEINSFELRGKDKEYKELMINSKAKTTIINGVTITGKSGIPVELDSENVTLDRVTINCNGFAVVLKAEETNVTVNRTNNILSSSDNVFITKKVNFNRMYNDIYANINMSGNMLVCGEMPDDARLTFEEGGSIIIIDEDKYKSLLEAFEIKLEANGGTILQNTKTVSLGAPVGSLPEPSRDYYSFDGWYTEVEGGERVTEDSLWNFETDTLYAHWTEHDLSAWTLLSDVPSNAEIVNRKYKFNQTKYTESTSTSLSGWSQYDSYWIQSDSGSFNYANLSAYDCNGWYSDFKSDRWYNYETETNKRVTDAWHSGYIYMHWCLGRTLSYPTNALVYRHPTDRPGVGYCGTFHSFTTWENSNNTDSSGSCYRYDHTGLCMDAYYWFKEPYYTCSYTDYYKMFKYQKTEEKESSIYPAGSNISNIQEWVQYREK